MLVHAYLDESGTHGNEPNVITVAGYLFKSEQSHRFSRECAKILKRFALEYFHQTDCANGYGQYNSMTKLERVSCQNELMAIIRRRSIKGFAASINVEQYGRLVEPNGQRPSAYTYALTGCLNNIRSWIESSKYTGEICYYFESGYKHQSDAERFIREDLALPRNGQMYRYLSHEFAGKRDCLPLQAADMLAWFTSQEFVRWKRGNTDRHKDFEALLRPQDTRILHNKDSLQKFRDIMDAHAQRS